MANNHSEEMPELEEIRKELRQLGKSMESLLHRSQDSLKEKGQEMFETAKERVQETVKKGQERADTVREYTEDHPWTALAGAALVGFFVGLLATKDRS